MSGSNGHRAERECTVCPPWVKWCAHFEGRILALIDEEMPTPEDLCEAHDPVTRTGFAVACGTEIGRCACGFAIAPSTESDNFPDLPAAEAEFHRRAEELRASP